ncbi:MAG TPA: CHASE2 domain-containing protein, partial [Ramlibacter sp.]|nr:CHASE2 domain-containing protein [Ramlibacter sp.]
MARPAARPLLALASARSRSIAASFLLACAAAGLGSLQGFSSLDFALTDLLRIPAPPPGDRVVVVAIDDASLSEVGRWPWSRVRYAEMLEQLVLRRPRAIGLDILLTEPGRPEEDALLADVVRRAGNLVLPVASQPDGFLLTPLPEFSRAAAATGRVDIGIDADGLVRGVPLNARDPEHFAVAMARAGGETIDARGCLAQPMCLLGFPAVDAGVRRYSAADLLANAVPPEAIAGAYVLVGVTATGLGDAYSTPGLPDRGLRPGVDILATALNGLLAGQMASRVPPLWNGFANALPVLLASIILLRVRPDRAWVAIAALVGACLLAVAVTRHLLHWQIMPLAGLLATIATYVAWSAAWLRRTFRFVFEEVTRMRAESGAADAPVRDLQHGFSELRHGSTSVLRAKQLLEQSLDGIADATLVVDAAGRPMLANAAATRLLPQARSLPGAYDLGALLRASLRPADASQAEPFLLSLEPVLLELVDAGGKRYLARSTPRGAPASPMGWLVTIAELPADASDQRLREETLGYLSHDMRAPQASILSLLELRRAGALEDTEAELLERIGKLAERTLAYADAFIQLARAESGEYRITLCNLLDVATEVADALWPRATSLGVHIEVSGEPAWCMADRDLVQRALQNLLDNALKFSAPGGRVLCVSRGDAGRAQLEVRDQGPGLGPSPDRLFERYTQADASRGGAGLGLAFVLT